MPLLGAPISPGRERGYRGIVDPRSREAVVQEAESGSEETQAATAGSLCCWRPHPPAPFWFSSSLYVEETQCIKLICVCDAKTVHLM